MAAAYYAQLPWVRLHRARVNAGQVVNAERAFTLGDSDFVLPKTADELIAPDFVSRVVAVLLAHPDGAMCAAAGLVIRGGRVVHVYPAEYQDEAHGERALAHAPPAPAARSAAIQSM